MMIHGLTINELVIGEGVPVVMLHGWGASSELLKPLGERLAPLGFRVYMPDLPGFGNSDAPPIPWTIYDYVDFVLAYFDHHGLDQVHLFGHSFGGRLGLILGAEYSARIMKMTLADAAGLRPPTPLIPQIRLKAYKAIRQGLNNIGLRSIAESLRGWYNNRYGSTDFNAVSGVMRQTFVQVVNEDLRQYAARVRVPVLLIWGEADADTPLWMGQELEKLIPDAGLVVYPGAGHYSYLENLGQTVKAMQVLYAG
ncbi:MAG: alpha/beta hydrolase [Phototrophicales bacterium]|nr:MAG: alpha/beta hydrolase [Phototrophicales bacterium]RMG76090.1 MAG: alpha/beta hydrolase [Chloroflexota bacterium]